MKEGLWIVSVSSGEIYEIIYITGSGYRTQGISGKEKGRSVYFQKNEVVPYWLQRYDEVVIKNGRNVTVCLRIDSFLDFQFYTDFSIYNENVLIKQFESF